MLNVFGKKIEFSPVIKNLKFSNPVLTASGTCGYGLECRDFFDINKIGGLVLKGTTAEPRPGNNVPRIAEFQGGIINSIGLQNVGIEKFINEIAPEFINVKSNIILNISGNSFEEYKYMTAEVNNCKHVHGIEINISCPNVKKGAIAFGQDPEMVFELVSLCRKETDKMITVKLTPNVTDITSIAVAAEKAGADAITCINTFRGLLFDLEKDTFALSNIVGGVSGPAIKPMALLAVYECAKKVNIPIIGVGGIFSPQDALEFLKVGASLVQIGTYMMTKPDSPVIVSKYLEGVLT
ncbi:MAG: dihydroorotate dehydrogenase [Candidatus Muiribacteriota bacterium]